MTVFWSVLSCLGAAVFLYRLRKVFFEPAAPQLLAPVSFEKLSVVIPARNEEKNLGLCLNSLRDAIDRGAKVIVVDDRSTDATAAIAAQFSVEVVTNPSEPPQGWSGKNWVCNLGAKHADRRYVLFTDADTVHSTAGLQRALNEIFTTESSLVTAFPFHLCPTPWERCLSSFHVLISVAAAPFDAGHRNWPYAIGQFLLFDKEAYLRLGGHTAVKGVFAEDLAFAQLCKKRKEKVSTCEGAFIFSVRMYDSFQAFCKGWMRILRWGMARSDARGFFETTAVICAFASGITFFATDLIAMFAGLTTLVSLFFVTPKLGQFSRLGSLVVLPLSLLLFVGLSVAAVCEMILKKDHAWRGRNYKA